MLKPNQSYINTRKCVYVMSYPIAILAIADQCCTVHNYDDDHTKI